MTNQEIDLLLLADTPENILGAHGYKDFSTYVSVLMRNDVFVKEREHAPLFTRWVLSSTRVKGRGDQRSIVVGNLLRVRILQVLNEQPRDLVAKDSQLSCLRGLLSVSRGTRADTAKVENLLDIALADNSWLCGVPTLHALMVRAQLACKAHHTFAGRGWAHVAALYDHPNAHRRMIHMLTHKSHVGRPRLD